MSLCCVKAFKLILQIKHLLFEFFLLHLIFVRQSHKPIVRYVAVYVILVHSLIKSKQFLASCRSIRQITLCRFSFSHRVFGCLIAPKVLQDIFVMIKVDCKLEQFHLYNLLQGILTNTMS